MDVDLSSRVVAITGASSGIGEATALAGAAVALGARRAERIEQLALRIVQEGGRAVALPTDVGDEQRARAFVEGADAELGRLDVLVNNAGVMLLGPIEDAPTDEWRQMIHANVFGVLYCTHAALPLMHAQGSGHIVNVSSVAGRVARAGAGVYNLTKFGVGAFSESLRQEAVPLGIRVTLVEPGAVATELVGHNRPEVIAGLAQSFGGVTPMDAEDIANAIVYAIGQPPNVSVNEVLIRPSGPGPVCSRSVTRQRVARARFRGDLRKCLAARVIDLQRRVVEREALPQHRLDSPARSVAVAVGADEHVRRERRKAARDLPHVQVVDLDNPLGATSARPISSGSKPARGAASRKSARPDCAPARPPSAPISAAISSDIRSVSARSKPLTDDHDGGDRRAGEAVTGPSAGCWKLPSTLRCAAVRARQASTPPRGSRTMPTSATASTRPPRTSEGDTSRRTASLSIQHGEDQQRQLRWQKALTEISTRRRPKRPASRPAGAWRDASQPARSRSWPVFVTMPGVGEQRERVRG